MGREEPDFKSAKHTFVLSDIHLSTEEKPHPKDPLWRKFKQKQFFPDEPFKTFVEKISSQFSEDAIELVLAGDILDFDGVTRLPKTHRFVLSWLERRRGLNSEERKSRFKTREIINDHRVFFDALKDFLKNTKNRLVFVIGNHDLELHWESVQKTILDELELSEEERTRVRFNNWFYISNGDTLIEHGNQYDSQNLCQKPINPKIRGRHRERIRLPFGSLAHRYLLNGMGYFNPHSERTYIMSFLEYIRFTLKHLLRREPLIMLTWFWGAIITLIATIREALSFEVKDPLRIEDQIETIAVLANSTPKMTRQLKELHAPPIYSNIWGVMRELWLDRALLVMVGIYFSYRILDLINIVWHVSYWWVILVLLLFLPFFVFYFRSVESKVPIDKKYYIERIQLIAKVANVTRVVFGHTHHFVHDNYSGIEYLNSGTWSPAFDDIACTKPMCPKTFVWIRPELDTDRVANVFEWSDSEMQLLC